MFKINARAVLNMEEMVAASKKNPKKFIGNPINAVLLLRILSVGIDEIRPQFRNKKAKGFQLFLDFFLLKF